MGMKKEVYLHLNYFLVKREVKLLETYQLFLHL